MVQAQVSTKEEKNVKAKLTKEEKIEQNKAIAVKAKAKFKEAVQLQKDGKIDESIDSYKRAVKIKSDYSLPLIKLGQIYESKKELDTALDYYQQAVRTEPKKARNHVALANIFRKQKKYNQAVATYENALELKPDLAEKIEREYANSLFAQKNSISEEKILEAYTNAMSKEKKLPHSFYIKTAQLLEEQKRFNDAIECYKKALQIKPDVCSTYVATGKALVKIDQFDTAINCYKKAIELDATSAAAYRGLAGAYVKQGDANTAIECYKKTIELNPSSTKLYPIIKELLTQQGRLDEANKYNVPAEV